jgi:hypothetical protein
MRQEQQQLLVGQLLEILLLVCILHHVQQLGMGPARRHQVNFILLREQQVQMHQAAKTQINCGLFY